MFHRCEQFSGNPTVTSDPSRTAFELSDPRHTPTSDCGMAPGAVAVVGEIGTAAVLPQLVMTSAVISFRMTLVVRTRGKLQHGYRLTAQEFECELNNKGSDPAKHEGSRRRTDYFCRWI